MRNGMTRLLTTLCITGLLIGCQPPAATEPTVVKAEPEIMLKTYVVPGGQVSEVGSMLNRLMRNNEEILGKASVTPGGQLVVLGPEGIHQGIAELLETIGELEPSGPPPTIEFTYWLVLGRASDEPKDLTRDGTIAPALQSLSQSQGAMEFQLMERIKVRSVSGEHAQTMGERAEIRQIATVSKDFVIANLNIESRGPSKIETQVRIPPGKLIVLGETGFRPRGKDKDRDEQATLYYIMKANILD